MPEQVPFEFVDRETVPSNESPMMVALRALLTQPKKAVRIPCEGKEQKKNRGALNKAATDLGLGIEITKDSTGLFVYVTDVSKLKEPLPTTKAPRVKRKAPAEAQPEA